MTMVRLPRSIIKKYGISKKAWSVFRSRKNNKRKTKVGTMAKSRRRRVFRGFTRRTARRTSTGRISPEKLVIPSLLYGAFRDDISNLAAKVPFVGSVGDNVVLGVGGYLLAKKGRGMLRDIGMSALVAEATHTGQEIRRGTLFSGIASKTASTSGVAPTFA